MGASPGAGSLTSTASSDDPGSARVVPRSGAAADTSAANLEALVRRVEGGDQEALAALYDLLAPRVHGLALRILRSPALAEEVTQDVFVHLWTHAGQIDPDRGSVLGYLLTVTHRRAVDRVRSEQAQSDRLHRYESQHVDRDYDVTAEEAVARTEAARVRTALESIGEPHRTALELAYFGGLTHRELAHRLEVPLGTVKTRIRDGLRKVRRQLTGGEQ